MPGYIRMKTISIVTGCFNEEENVEELYTRVRNVMAEVGRYRYEHIFIDNSSSDRTVEVLKRIAAADTNVRVIVNARNFGHIRSPLHAVLSGLGRRHHRNRGRPPGPAGNDPPIPRGMGRGRLHGAGHQERQRRKPAHVLDPQDVLPAGQQALLHRDLRELHGLWAVRSPGDRHRQILQRSVPLFSRRDRRDRAAFQNHSLQSATAQARHHQEQFLFVVRHGDAGDYEPLEGAAARW